MKAIFDPKFFRWKYFCYAIALAIFLVTMFHFFQLITDREKNSVKNLESNIEYRFSEAENWQRYDLRKRLYPESHQKKIYIKILLPKFEEGDNCLYIESIDIAVRIYYEGKNIYQHGEWNEKNEAVGFANFFSHLILLPPEASGKNIYAEVYADWKTIGFSGEVSLGNYHELNEKLIRIQIPNFAFGFFYGVSGVFALLLYFTSKDKLLLYFGFCSMSLLIICIIESDINLTKYRWDQFSAIIGVHAYFGMVFFFTKYIGEIFEGLAKKLINYYSFLIFLAYIYAMYFLNSFGFTRMYCDFVEIPIAITSGIGAILVILIAIYHSFKGNTNAKILIFGLIVFFTAFPYYLAYQYKLTDNTPADVHIRFFPVMLGLMWMIAIRYRSNLEKLQEYTGLLKDTMDKLEERVKEKTIDLEEANYQLTKANNSKSEFFANVSHEFKTPLTLILSPLEKLAKSIQNTELQFLISIIHRNTNRIQSLVEELLAIAKIDFGVFTEEKVDVELGSYFQRMAEEFRIICDEKKIEFRLIEPGSHLFYKIDKHHWDLIIRNLISNAVKFTKHGYVELSYRIEETTIRIDVVDTGIGIAPEEIELIFERFYQSERNKFISVVGTGIGLYLVKEMVSDCKGIISVSSEVDKGSRFSLSLPILPTDSFAYITGQSKLKSIESYHSNHDIIVKKEVKILLVEDEPSMVDFLVYLLKDKYEITSVSHTEEAKTKIEQNQYDLILSDWTLPGENGLVLLEFLKRKDKNIPFLFLTARTEQNIFETAFNLGADDFIKKPFQSEDLLSRIHQKINKSKDHKQDLIVEKDTIYGDIHDIIGGKLTDLLLQINFLRTLPQVTGDHLSNLRDLTNLLSLELRTKLHDWEDFRNIQKDFELGWMSMLVRRYSNSGRSCRIKLDEELDWKEADYWDQNFKVEIFRISQEIANNDLKYGFGTAQWKISEFFPRFTLEVKTKTNYSASNLRGRGSRNMEERCQRISANFSQESIHDDFLIKISAESKKYIEKLK